MGYAPAVAVPPPTSSVTGEKVAEKVLSPAVVLVVRRGGSRHDLPGAGAAAELHGDVAGGVDGVGSGAVGGDGARDDVRVAVLHGGQRRGAACDGDGAGGGDGGGDRGDGRSSATALMVVKVFGWATAGSAISTVTGPLAVVVKAPVELVAEPTGSTWNV